MDVRITRIVRIGRSPRAPSPGRALQLALVTLLLSLAGCSDPIRPHGPAAQSAGTTLQPELTTGDPTWVTGTGDPAIDVPAVQSAVDAGGTVVLRGTFSFEGVAHAGPTNHHFAVLVQKSVEIRGENATILGGGSAGDDLFQAAFLVDAPDAAVTFDAIRFEEPVNAAIRAIRAGDLRVSNCEIDGIIPSAFGSLKGAVGIDVRGGPFGDVRIVDNRLRIGGTAEDAAGGVVVVVNDGTAARVDVLGNRISETTTHGMNLQNVGGPARVERNIVVTGPVGRGGGPGQFVDALRVLGTGEYRVMGNELDCGFENGAVVRVAATTSAEVLRNEITSSIAAGTEPGAESAAIQVRGSATGNEIQGNRIRGRGRVAISVVHSGFGPDKPPDTDGNPRETTFSGNNVQPFDATLATVEVEQGAVNTTIIGGSGTLLDNGTGTVIRGDYTPPTGGT